MILYVEEEFLVAFNKLPAKNAKSKSNHIIANIFSSYGNLTCYTNVKIESLADIDKLKSNNIKFSYNSPITVVSIKDHFFENQKRESTMIFSAHSEAWHKDAEDLGALCFSLNNYKKRIKQICEICDSIKVDLSQQFPGWNIFNELRTVPKNSLVINDNFLIKNNSIHSNVKHLLESIVSVENKSHTEIFTEHPRNYTINAALVYKNFTKQLEMFALSLQLILRNRYEKINFHDRMLYSNFFYIEIPVGFNFSTTKPSDSIIRVEHIFDKFHYDRVKNHMLHFNKVKESYADVYPK